MATKKTVAKKPVKAVKKVKKVVSKHAATKKPVAMKSFRIYKDKEPFTKARVSRQTLYWAILLAFILITQLWILKIQLDIANLNALITAAQ